MAWDLIKLAAGWIWDWLRARLGPKPVPPVDQILAATSIAVLTEERNELEQAPPTQEAALQALKEGDA